MPHVTELTILRVKPGAFTGRRILRAGANPSTGQCRIMQSFSGCQWVNLCKGTRIYLQIYALINSEQTAGQPAPGQNYRRL
jgi:hypothetical protein